MNSQPLTREQAIALLPVIQAIAEGKALQRRERHDYSHEKIIGIQHYKAEEPWKDDDALNIDTYRYEYRIKPTQGNRYRPFKSADDCFKEMRKHQPFGWLKDHIGYTQITAVSDSDDRRVKIICHIDDQDIDEQMIARSYTFADGEPFGVKED